MLTVFGLFAENELLEEYADLSQEERIEHFFKKYHDEFEECKKNFQNLIDEDVERIRRCFSGEKLDVCEEDMKRVNIKTSDDYVSYYIDQKKKINFNILAKVVVHSYLVDKCKMDFKEGRINKEKFDKIYYDYENEFSVVNTGNLKYNSHEGFKAEIEAERKTRMDAMAREEAKMVVECDFDESYSDN